MNRVLLLPSIGLMLSFGLARADAPASNLQHDEMQVGMEFFAAQKLISSNGSLQEIKSHCETARDLLVAFRRKYPNWNPDFEDTEQLALNTEIEIVSWQLEANPRGNANDPQGLMNVEVHLRNRLAVAQKLMASASDSVAEKTFENCAYSWGDLQLRHPKWQPAMIKEDIRNSLIGIHYAKHPKSRYRDPKLGTPLSV